MNRTVLMIAYHYPPVQGSSGVHRTLQFSRHLQELGWQTVVLTVHPRAYAATTDSQLGAIHPDTVVHRAFALDTSRHLSVFGYYPRALARPDRWVSWWLGGTVAGLRLIRKYQPSVIWSTYPIATAHAIGQTLHKRTGLPWVADFRDSMTEPDYPYDPRIRASFLRIEQCTVAACARAVFTTPGAVRMYAERYPELPASRWFEIPNGYDEDSFREAEAAARNSPRPTGAPLHIVHSGVLYPVERDPLPLFDAVSRLKKAGILSAERAQIVLRATGHDEVYRPHLLAREIEDIVRLEPALPYQDALREMLEADGLLLLQSASCNHQIPAKLYEYLRASRPIIALTDDAGDTACAIRRTGGSHLAPLTDAARIAITLQDFIGATEEGRCALADATLVRALSREAQTARLASLLTDVAG